MAAPRAPGVLAAQTIAPPELFRKAAWCLSVFLALGLTDFSIARGFPAMRDLTGKMLADGEYNQWTENGQVHVTVAYQFADGRRIEEQAVFRQGPLLVQEQWSWRELRNAQPSRRFAVNFLTGVATAEKREDDGPKRWSETVEVTKGRTFAGIGFTLAIADNRARLIKGEKVELDAFGFTPKPRAVSVEISYAGLDQMRMGGRLLRGDRFVIHPEIPLLAKLFVDVPDTRIWLTNPPPAAFLRWEGPLAEPGDPVIRVDMLPGGESSAAEPVAAGGAR